MRLPYKKSADAPTPAEQTLSITHFKNLEFINLIGTKI